MNIQQFQYILAVAEYKHFELASEKCNITQSTLSTMISKFEDEIGFKVFDRKKKPVVPTAEGKLVIEQLKVIGNSIEQLNELTKEIKGEIAGKLSLSVIPTIAPFLLPVFLKDFAAEFPNLNIIVREETTAEIQKKLKSRELDIGIISIPLLDDELLEVKLFDEPFLFFDTELSTSKKISLKKVKMENLCLLDEGHCMRTQVLQICNENINQVNANLNLEYKAGSIDSLLRFVKANKGTTLIPYLAASDFSEQEKEHLSNFTSPVPFRTVGLIVHRHFVKKKLLVILQKIITQKIAGLMPQIILKGNALSPVNK
jgi:LysR family hydrogen peroxide-inducible transcriptional activator